PTVGAQLAPEVVEKLKHMREGVVELCQNGDLVIYDTMFTREEYVQRPHWGHSTPEDGVEVARDAGAKHLMLFHHAPERTDDEQDEITRRTQDAVSGSGPALKVSAAYESLELEIEAEGGSPDQPNGAKSGRAARTKASASRSKRL